MSELSLFLDESGSDNLRDTYYILALVVHEQSDGLSENIARYQESLRDKGLPDVPFHATPLLNGHGAHEGMDVAMRKRLFSAFRVFFRHLPVSYGLVMPRTREYATLDDVAAAMRRRIVDFLFDNLAYLQGFDGMKIYYDDGQQSIARALHKAIDYALSKNAITYRPAPPPTTASRRQPTTSAQPSSRRSSTRARRPPRPTRSFSAAGLSSRRASSRR